jgi:hypothetical protein
MDFQKPLWHTSLRASCLNHLFITRTNVLHWCYESTISKTLYVEMSHTSASLHDSRATLLRRCTVVTADNLVLSCTGSSWAQFIKSTNFWALSNTFYRTTWEQCRHGNCVFFDVTQGIARVACFCPFETDKDQGYRVVLVSERSASGLIYSKVCRLSYPLWSLAGRHVDTALFSSTSLSTGPEILLWART